jgi:23S rRNA (cytidine1920-2'-O)/16S rRNA (cytidine1409-2'-O)-methyltransferase
MFALFFVALQLHMISYRYGLLDYRLRQDPRVVLLERTNAKYLNSTIIPEPGTLFVNIISINITAIYLCIFNMYFSSDAQMIM